LEPGLAITHKLVLGQRMGIEKSLMEITADLLLHIF
jgi:hypothetical protein